jgi:hypothetical protein
MLTKEQAIAAMDAQIIRVESERRQRLEVRIGRLRTLYPGLRRVPVDEIHGLVQEARLDALKQWTLYAILVLALGLVSWFALLGPLLDQGASVQPAMLLWFIPAIGTMNLFVYLHMRAFLNGRSVLRNSTSQD